MSHEVHSKLARVKNGLLHYGEVRLLVEEFKSGPSIHEAYTGQGWVRQGQVEDLSSNGYDLWKAGIRQGLQYGIDRLDLKNVKVTVVEACGLITDTSPAILSYVASRALLDNFPNGETEQEKQLFEHLVYTSFNYEDALPNLKTFTVNGRKRKNSPYNVQQ